RGDDGRHGAGRPVRDVRVPSRCQARGSIAACSSRDPGRAPDLWSRPVRADRPARARIASRGKPMSSHATIRPRPGVLDIAPYVGGAASIKGANRAVKLSANENPHGPSPKAVEAYRSVAGELNLYPESHGSLARAIAGVHGIEAERIVLGAGSDELIALL